MSTSTQIFLWVGHVGSLTLFMELLGVLPYCSLHVKYRGWTCTGAEAQVLNPRGQHEVQPGAESKPQHHGRMCGPQPLSRRGGTAVAHERRATVRAERVSVSCSSAHTPHAPPVSDSVTSHESARHSSSSTPHV